jgi:chemotaxis protein methyltransferase CheR
MININEFFKLRDLIYRRSGIYIDDKKYESLSSKIDKIMEKNGLRNFREMFHQLRFKKDNALFQEIINAVTVNETYFFRENHQFISLINEVLVEIDKEKTGNESIKILCAPSSTGEEAYSIALHLIDEGELIEKRDFELVGIDIDSNVINKAKKGLYTERSIKFVPKHLLKEYFTQKGNFYEIDDFLKDVVDFRVVNIMDRYALKRLGKFDVIFSRNMLIYFDDQSRKEVAMNFYEILNNGGYIFLGHAENMSRIVSVFKTVRLSNAIAYKKEVL